MSVHTVTGEVAETGIVVVSAGTEFGPDRVHQPAVVFISDDDRLVLEGSYEDLMDFGLGIMQRVSAHRKAAQG